MNSLKTVLKRLTLANSHWNWFYRWMLTLPTVDNQLTHHEILHMFLSCMFPVSNVQPLTLLKIIKKIDPCKSEKSVNGFR
jgi:hypothetical protein